MIPSKPVRVECFDDADKLETRLNDIATTPGNRWDLKFLTKAEGYYTAVFCYVPEDQT